MTVPPSNAIIIGSNEKCACQALIIPDRVLSVQGSQSAVLDTNPRTPGIQSRDNRGFVTEEISERTLWQGHL